MTTSFPQNWQYIYQTFCYTLLPVLKKIGNISSILFVITKIEKPCIIAGILLINQKQSIIDLEIQTHTLN